MRDVVVVGSGHNGLVAAAYLARYRYSPRAGMQIHMALSAPLRWLDRRLNQVPVIHVHAGARSVALACAQAAAGLLPADPTIVVGQQGVLDLSRAPDGRAVLRNQLQRRLGGWLAW